VAVAADRATRATLGLLRGLTVPARGIWLTIGFLAFGPGTTLPSASRAWESTASARSVVNPRRVGDDRRRRRDRHADDDHGVGGDLRPVRGRWSNTVPAAGRASTRVWTVGGALKPASCSWPCATNALLAPFSSGVVTLCGSWV
jgi:hypothetical protein